MSQPYYIKSIVPLVAVIFASHVVYRYIVWKKKTDTKEINEVILFSETTQLVPSKYSLHRSRVHPSADRILFYLNQTHYTMDICMYMLTNRDISYLIQKLHYRGVRIRFIVDAETAYVNGSETKRLDRIGAIELRWMKTDKNIMHHKFCVIDASADTDKKLIPFIMTGSLNWTMQGLSGNWESVVVMSEPKLVRRYKEEFEELWKKFAPPVHLMHT